MAAALLFGASTPLAEELLRDTSPMPLAGLPYLGSDVDLHRGSPRECAADRIYYRR